MEKELFVFEYPGILENSKIESSIISQLQSKIEQNSTDIRIISDLTLFAEGELESKIKKEFNLNPTQVIDGTFLTIQFLKANNISIIFAIGSDNFITRLQKSGIKVYTENDHEDGKIEEIELKNDLQAVIISIDPQYSFRRISIATRYVIEKKCLYYSIGSERRFQKPNGNYYAGAYTLATPISSASFSEIKVIGMSTMEIFNDLSSFSEIHLIGTTEALSDYSKKIQTINNKIILKIVQ